MQPHLFPGTTIAKIGPVDVVRQRRSRVPEELPLCRVHRGSGWLRLLCVEGVNGIVVDGIFFARKWIG